MCVISNIGDGWKESWPNRWPNINPSIPIEPQVTRHEFEELKKELEALKKLLIAAKEYDRATNQPDCEMEDKVELIKRVAKELGIDMSEVFK